MTEYLTPNPKKVHSESDVAHEVIVCSNLFLLLSGGGSYPSRHQNPLPSCHQNPCYHTNHNGTRVEDDVKLLYCMGWKDDTMRRDAVGVDTLAIVVMTSQLSRGSV